MGSGIRDYQTAESRRSEETGKAFKAWHRGEMLTADQQDLIDCACAQVMARALNPR